MTRGDQPARDEKKLVVLDSDGGVDDAAGLWFLLVSPMVEILAVTACWGNVPVGVAASNLARVCHEAGFEAMPIAMGKEEPMGPNPELRPATWIHGEDGFGNTNRQAPPHVYSKLDASALIAQQVQRHPSQVTLITMGPLTNLADFVLRYPSAVELVGQLVVMGGCVTTPGNALPIGEANIAHDPSAAAVVANANWASPPFLIGLDVTTRVPIGEDVMALIERGLTAPSRDLREALAFYGSQGLAHSAAPGFPCHDLVAAIAAVDPSLCEAPVLPMAVDTSGGAAWGTTVVDRRIGGPPDESFAPWRIALDVDVSGTAQRMMALFDGSLSSLRREESLP